MFNARKWLAGQISCERNDLELSDGRVRSDYRGAQDGRYARGPAYAGRVIVTGPKTFVETEPREQAEGSRQMDLAMAALFFRGGENGRRRQIANTSGSGSFSSHTRKHTSAA